MATHHNLGAQYYLDFCERVAALTSVSAVMDDLATTLDPLGFEHFVITLLPTTGQTFEQAVITRRWPKGWFEHYVSHEFVRVDPVIRQCRRSTMPFDWRDAPYDPEREPEAHRVMTDARDYTMLRGYSLPVHGFGGFEACFSFAGRHVDLGPVSAPGLHTMAVYAFEQVRKLRQCRGAPPSPLSGREREVLLWSAHGDSAQKIGERLNLSARTVESHVTNAAAKLGVRTKIQAVALAIQDRLILI